MPEGYTLYAAAPADFVGSGSRNAPLIVAPVDPITGAAPTVKVWTDRTVGAQVTDLLDIGEAAVSEVPTDDFGGFPFWAPNGLGTLWVTTGDSTAKRYEVNPSGLGTWRDSVDATIADVQSKANLIEERVHRPGFEWDQATSQFVPVTGDRPEYDAIMPGDEAAPFPPETAPVRTKFTRRVAQS